MRKLFEARGEYNVFHDYYRKLVQALHDEGVTRNVFCVNVDALIATLLLKMMWPAWQAGSLASSELETAAFTAFLYGRLIGCARDRRPPQPRQEHGHPHPAVAGEVRCVSHRPALRRDDRACAAGRNARRNAGLARPANPAQAIEPIGPG